MPEVSPDWSVLTELAGYDELTLRRLLRSHKEVGFDRDDSGRLESQTRARLDSALDAIGRLELRAQTGGDLAYVDHISGFRHLLENSPSFHHYIDTYLYFKVRFAAGRLGLDYNAAGPCNEVLPTLPPPPSLVVPQEQVEAFTGFQNSPNVDIALQFLDDYFEQPHESATFELWLRGLVPPTENAARFRAIALGMFEWALSRSNFYGNLEISRANATAHIGKLFEGDIREGDWQARNPLAARCGVVEYYWLAKLLRAEVSPRSGVRYVDRSWLSYLPGLSQRDENLGGIGFDPGQIRRIEEILRAAFDYAGELIENAVEISEYRARKAAYPLSHPVRPKTTVDWRAAYDFELDDIAQQRALRTFADSSPRDTAIRPTGSNLQADHYWSKRVRTGAHQENLVGLALSGGGIRSATFSLGILQRLKELDLLRRVDYLSTVSGGGYIGSWLTANVRRTHYWLSPMTSWDESIGHLRRYSKYLAPRTGLLSADTWVVGGTWIRNAFLIQLTAFTWLCGILLVSLGLKALFDLMADPRFQFLAPILLLLVLLVLPGSIVINLLNIGPHQGYIFKGTQHRGTVLTAWAGCLITAALLWNEVEGPKGYAVFLKTAISEWPPYLSVALLLAVIAMALASLLTKEQFFRREFHPAAMVGSVSIGLTTFAVSYAALCGVLYVFGVWGYSDVQFGWYAYIFGPAMVMLSVTLSVLIFIGLIGDASDDWRREWWTRYGSWLALFGTAFMAVSVAAVFGPYWIEKLTSPKTWYGVGVKWGVVVTTWAGSTVASLMAGNSSKTRGSNANSSKLLEWVARTGAVLFIVGAVLFASAALRFVMTRVWLDAPSTDEWQRLQALLSPGWAIPASLVLLIFCGVLFSWRFNLNIFGLNQFYRNRIVRCYLGATRWIPGLRSPHPFIGFDEADDLNLSDMRYEKVVCAENFRGPFPLINCSLNLGGSSDLQVHTRQSASFTLTPLHAGADRSMVGYSPIGAESGLGEPVTLGQAVSVSGAAASPNMGYHTSPLVSVLLTIFNVRLGWWFPNPGVARSKWSGTSSPSFSLVYLLQEFLGLADEKSKFVNISDGGHFENLGIYELVRRRAKVIIACDGECDSDLAFGSLGSVIRICETDFNARISIDVQSIRKQPNSFSVAHCAVGRITYSNGSLGYLIYLKSSVTGDEEVGIEQYRAGHPTFPHESTSDQFFSEDQFEAYRRLGYHIASQTFRSAETETNPVYIAERLFDAWAPSGFKTETFLAQARDLDRIWERFRTAGPVLEPLFHELVADRPAVPLADPLTLEESTACLELLQLMENVFIDLRLEDFWDHPDNRGWAMLFTSWAKSPRFRAAWSKVRRSFGIRFEYFCGERLGLPTDHPVVRT